MKIESLVGKIFDRLEIIEQCGSDKHGKLMIEELNNQGAGYTD